MFNFTRTPLFLSKTQQSCIIRNQNQIQATIYINQINIDSKLIVTLFHRSDLICRQAYARFRIGRVDNERNLYSAQASRTGMVMTAPRWVTSRVEATNSVSLS